MNEVIGAIFAFIIVSVIIFGMLKKTDYDNIFDNMKKSKSNDSKNQILHKEDVSEIITKGNVENKLPETDITESLPSEKENVLEVINEKENSEIKLPEINTTESLPSEKKSIITQSEFFEKIEAEYKFKALKNSKPKLEPPESALLEINHEQAEMSRLYPEYLKNAKKYAEITYTTLKFNEFLINYANLIKTMQNLCKCKKHIEFHGDPKKDLNFIISKQSRLKEKYINRAADNLSYELSLLSRKSTKESKLNEFFERIYLYKEYLSNENIRHLEHIKGELKYQIDYGEANSNLIPEIIDDETIDLDIDLNENEETIDYNNLHERDNEFNIYESLSGYTKEIKEYNPRKKKSKSIH